MAHFIKQNFIVKLHIHMCYNKTNAVRFQFSKQRG